jgi:hypothetical protein
MKVAVVKTGPGVTWPTATGRTIKSPNKLAEAPTPEVVVDGLPARHVVRQQPPSASGADQVQDCVQDREAIMFRGALVATLLVRRELH